jgi:hypothetical protein
MILTHRDVFSELSVRSLIRGDAGHRKGRATRSERSEKTQVLSPLGRVGGRQQALEMSRIAPASTCGLLPTRRDPGAIPMGQYHQDLVSTDSSTIAKAGPLGSLGILELWRAQFVDSLTSQSPTPREVDCWAAPDSAFSGAATVERLPDAADASAAGRSIQAEEELADDAPAQGGLLER